MSSSWKCAKEKLHPSAAPQQSREPWAACRRTPACAGVQRGALSSGRAEVCTGTSRAKLLFPRFKTSAMTGFLQTIPDTVEGPGANFHRGLFQTISGIALYRLFTTLIK